MKLVLLFAGLSMAAGCTTTDAGPAVPVDPGVLYSQMCARCHGADGHGDAQLKQTMPKLQDFSDPQFRGRTNDEIEQVIMAGKDQMPAFGGMVSAPKIQALTGYVKRLGSK